MGKCKNTISDFHKRYDKVGECWVWKSYTNGKYPKFYYQGVFHYAHRLSYQLFNGPLLDGQVVCHKCDNPLCVNPDHLFAGSQQDNINDSVTKKRYAHGTRVPQAKLNEEMVRSILMLRDKYQYSARILGEMFGVATMTAHRVIVRKRWKHVAPQICALGEEIA